MNRAVGYSIDDLFAEGQLGADFGGENTPQFQSTFTDGVGPGAIVDGDMIANFQQVHGAIYSGKAAFDNTTAGYRLGIDDGTAKFYIGNSSNYLNWTGSALNISGVLTATSGSIGGFTIGATTITGTNLTLDSSGQRISLGSGNDIIIADADDSTYRLWIGNATAASAPFRVQKDGTAVATAFTHSGGSITGVPISSIPNNSSTDISLLSATLNLVFSATDNNTIAWTSGTIALSNGRTFSISSGNTGNMAALTYIYLDPAVSSTVLQTTTTYSTAMGGNKLLIGTAQNQTVAASFIPYHAGHPVVSGDQLQALSVQTASIANLAVTNAKINDLAVSKLTAGSITSQDIVLAANGSGDSVIRSGKTDFNNSNAGFILGIDDSDSDTAKFYIGNTTSFINWDGAALTVQGVSQVTKIFTAGEALTAGDAVFVADGTEIDSIDIEPDGSGVEVDSTTRRFSQGFTTRPATSGGLQLTGGSFDASRDGGASGTVTIAIYAASGGQPTGAALVSTTKNVTDIVANGSGSNGTGVAFTFSSPLTVTASTQYCLVIYSGDLSGGSFSIDTNFGATYSGGSLFMSNNSGSSWADQSADLGFLLNFTFATSGRVYKSSARLSELSAAFIGFVKTTTSSGQSAPIIISGEAPSSGLSIGGQYYLSDTYGAISSSAGTVTRKAGIAMASTSLLITNIW